MITWRLDIVRGSLVLFLVLVFAQGCNRRCFYRQQADSEAYCLIEQKRRPDCWPVGRYHLDVDPSSRMFDPFDLDCPPMPPDDPNSHRYMHCVDCKDGYACWHRCGDRDQVEGPGWQNSLLYDDCNIVQLNEEKSVELALLHSPEYQRNLETLYLSALDVSFERFQFDVQLFSGGDLFFTHSGPDRNNSGNTFNSLTLNSGSTLSRRFATGAQLLVGLANSFLWDFSGNSFQTASSLLNFSIVQPLLRGGGRHVALENLTQVERTLLANVRQMERFRRQFYVEVFAGRNTDTGPIDGGVGLGALSGSTNTTGATGGYLGLLETAQDIRNQRSNIASLQNSVAQLEAFFLAGRIDLLQVEFSRQSLFSAQSRLLASERALRAAEDQFKITLGLPPSLDLELDDSLIQSFQLVDPDIIPLQNEITRIQERVGQATNDIISLSDLPDSTSDSDSESGDRPEALPDPDSFLEPDATQNESGKSNLLDRLLARAESATETPSEGGQTPDDMEGTLDTSKPRDNDDGIRPMERRLTWNPEVEEKLKQIQQLLGEAREVLDDALAIHVPKAREDNKRLRSSIGDRRENADQLRERLKERLRQRLLRSRGECDNSGPGEAESEKSERDDNRLDTDVDALLPFDAERLEALPVILDDTIADIVKQIGLSKIELRRLNNDIDEILSSAQSLDPSGVHQALREKVFTAVPTELNNISATILSLTLVQARARTESVTLPRVDLSWQEAVEIARCNRLDWMNARAALVDAWRQIEISANELEGQLDFIVEGDISSLNNNPLGFRTSTGRIRSGIQFDAPLTRLLERNLYRESQIVYQRARRAFYRFEDNVTASLRDILRRMEINEINFELNRAGIGVAISQVELSRFRLQEPPRPNEEASFSPTTARDLVSALNDLLNVQNEFLSVWTSQEALRRALDLDLGTMQLDGAGLWIDPGELVGRQGCIVDEIVDESGQSFVLPDPNNPQPERIPPPQASQPSFLMTDPADDPPGVPRELPAGEAP